jgi:hypothetical protein
MACSFFPPQKRVTDAIREMTNHRSTLVSIEIGSNKTHALFNERSKVIAPKPVFPAKSVFWQRRSHVLLQLN